MNRGTKMFVLSALSAGVIGGGYGALASAGAPGSSAPVTRQAPPAPTTAPSKTPSGFHTCAPVHAPSSAKVQDAIPCKPGYRGH